MSVKSFEDLLVWQRARRISGRVYGVTRGAVFRRDWGLVDQMRRASVSMMSNIAEGFERRHPRDFARFLVYAKASCAELRAQTYLAQDVGYLDRTTARTLLNELSELGRMIGSLILKVEQR